MRDVTTLKHKAGVLGSHERPLPGNHGMSVESTDPKKPQPARFCFQTRRQFTELALTAPPFFRDAPT
jgi:hypothetical protein